MVEVLLFAFKQANNKWLIHCPELNVKKEGRWYRLVQLRFLTEVDEKIENTLSFMAPISYKHIPITEATYNRLLDRQLEEERLSDTLIRLMETEDFIQQKKLMIFVFEDGENQVIDCPELEVKKVGKNADKVEKAFSKEVDKQARKLFPDYELSFEDYPISAVSYKRLQENQEPGEKLHETFLRLMGSMELQNFLNLMVDKEGLEESFVDMFEGLAEALNPENIQKRIARSRRKEKLKKIAGKGLLWGKELGELPEPTSRKEWDTYFEKLIKHKKFSEAETKLQNLVEEDPDDYMFLFNLALLYYEKKDYDQGRKFLEKTFEKLPPIEILRKFEKEELGSVYFSKKSFEKMEELYKNDKIQTPEPMNAFGFIGNLATLTVLKEKI